MNKEEMNTLLARYAVLEDTRKVIEGLREALEALAWYGNEANYAYDDFESIPGHYQTPGIFVHDDGERARRAIEKIEAITR